jgi:hypothetical protein
MLQYILRKLKKVQGHFYLLLVVTVIGEERVMRTWLDPLFSFNHKPSNPLCKRKFTWPNNELKESILLIKNKSVALEIKKRISSVDQKTVT